ncbi:MAG TPA: hypothetical protein VLM89_00295, partial [Phycisphaerae bacterium]|nr:hypothetical protein [Phycisphaerae bacterium]
GWQQHIAIGFPQFLEGKFDRKVGHLMPPSLRFDLDGGSLGFRYVGRDIAVRPNSDYLVGVWVKTEGVHKSRAYLTASFLDRRGNLIPGTERRSELIGGEGKATDWKPVALPMRCDNDDVRNLSLGLWFTQDRIWNDGPKRIRSIDREDVKVTAWFDDLVVYRMPRVSLGTAQAGNVFSLRDPLELRVELSDPDGMNLRGRIVVRDADGQVVCERAVPVQTDARRGGQTVTLPDLPVGWYRADFPVTTEAGTLLSRSVCFVRLAERTNLATSGERRFGVVLGDIDPAVAGGQRQLLGELGLQWVKVPVWHAQEALLGQVPRTEALDGCLQIVREVQADPVGILRDGPGFTARPEETRLLSMLDLFEEPASVWKHLIAPVWTRYAGLIQVWQMGADDQPAPLPDDATFGLVPRVRQEMAGLMTDPVLAATRSVRLPVGADDPADYRSVLLPSSIRPGDIEGHLKAQVGKDANRLWVTVDPLPEGRYPRELRLADLGRRLIEASHLGAGAVFLEAPWDVRKHALEAWVDPREDYIILRTVAGVIGGARPVSRTTLDGTVECVIFDHRGSAVLCVWDPYAPHEGREHQIELGGRIQQLDLWGRNVFPPAAGGRQMVRVGPTPTFLLNCPTWLIEFRRQFSLRPVVVEADSEKLELEIEFRNTHPHPLSGMVRLILPDDWDIRPNRLAFSLPAGGEYRQKIEVRYPPNAQTRVMPLIGEFAIDADRRYEFTTPAWFEFGIAGLDMSALAFRSDKQVTVRLTMTNRTDQTLHFEAYLVAPDRQRLERQFSDFQPGASLTRSFVIPEAADLAGRNVRLSLREIQGNRFWNRIVAIP